ncbi:MAG: BlaI/MecI/CopY family transcriptional regulator [Crocinitomicaceae bacterium]
MKELTKAEEMVMQALWKINRGFAKEITEAIEYDKKKPAYNTVLTMIRILVDKGFIKYETYGKSNLYEPVISKEEYSKSRLKSITKRYFNGSPKSMLSFFAREENLNLDDLEEIIKELKKK